jgi:hypothetical protein
MTRLCAVVMVVWALIAGSLAQKSPTPSPTPNAANSQPVQQPSTPPAGTAEKAKKTPVGRKKVSTPAQTEIVFVPGDFRGVLSDKTKSPCSGLACGIIWDCNGKSVGATVIQLAPWFAKLTYVKTESFTPAVVSVGRSTAVVADLTDQCKPSLTPPVTDNGPVVKQNVHKNVVITGSFSARDVSECQKDEGTHCAVLLDKDEQTVVGRVKSVIPTRGGMVIDYEAPSGKTPAFVRIGSPGTVYNFTVAPNNAEVLFEQVITGDFCQKDANCNCQTELLKPASSGTCQSRQIKANPTSGVTGYVQDANGSSKPLLQPIDSLSDDGVGIAFNAPSDYKPAWLVLMANSSSYRFAYVPALPLQTSDLIYTEEHVHDLCQNDCANLNSTNISLKPLTVNSEASFIAIQNKLLIARVTAPMGQEPVALIACRTQATVVCVTVRRTIKPGGNNQLLNVNMTIMDQETVARNFGHRIASRYLVVNLDITNPTKDKLQFRKSAMYFDVDYVEAKQKKGYDFKQDMKTIASFGLFYGSSYDSSFQRQKRKFRFGLEQNAHHSPLNYLTVLGSYDYGTELLDRDFKFFELLGAVLTTMSNGHVIADKSNTAFTDAVSILAGSFLPGLRALVLNPEGINRRRANLVAQTLQDAIEIPPAGSTTTMVLLPRLGILAFNDAEVPVVVDKVIDVHVDTNVLTPIANGPVQKNVVSPGETKDQVREAVGEPTGVVTNPDNTSTFTYATGPIASVAFDAQGKVVSSTSRSLADQLNATTTLIDAKQVLSDASVSATSIDLVDGTVILVDIPNVTTILHFDSSGKRLADYTPLFKDIKALEGKAKSDLDNFLETKALSDGRKNLITNQANKAVGTPISSPVQYSSPDITNGTVIVTFDDPSGKITQNSTVKSITFGGPKPSGVS